MILADLRRSDRPVSGLSESFLAAFPVAGVALSTVGDLLGSETLAASNDVSRHVDELQFDLGEGPCWEAIATVRPVYADRLERDGAVKWPAFTQAAVATGVISLFAFPLFVGPLRFGAIDMYSDRPVSLGRGHRELAVAMAQVVSRRVLDSALSSIDSVEMPDSPFSRRIVHQATGMVFAQLGLSMDDSRLVIHGHAFAHDLSVMDVAQRVIDGELAFAATDSGIQELE